MNLIKKHATIKFCYTYDKNATETYEMLKQAPGNEPLSKVIMFEWFKHLENDQKF